MRTLTVVGHGSAAAVPDRAVLHVTAVHRASSLAEALAGAESAREILVATARGTTDDIASQDLGVRPAYDDRGNRAGFEARHTLLLRCADVVGAGELVTAVAAAVGDRFEVNHVALSVADPGAGLAQAREAAFADARSRAGHLAGLAGGVLGEVQSVVEGSHQSPPHPAAVAVRAEVSFEPGGTTFTESLTVTWQLL